MSTLFSVELVSLEPPVLTYRLYGALFFGAAAKLDLMPWRRSSVRRAA